MTSAEADIHSPALNVSQGLAALAADGSCSSLVAGGIVGNLLARWLSSVWSLPCSRDRRSVAPKRLGGDLAGWTASTGPPSLRVACVGKRSPFRVVITQVSSHGISLGRENTDDHARHPYACDPTSQQLISPLHLPLTGRGHQPVPLRVRRTNSSAVQAAYASVSTAARA